MSGAFAPRHNGVLIRGAPGGGRARVLKVHRQRIRVSRFWPIDSTSTLSTSQCNRPIANVLPSDCLPSTVVRSPSPLDCPYDHRNRPHSNHEASDQAYGPRRNGPNRMRPPAASPEEGGGSTRRGPLTFPPLWPPADSTVDEYYGWPRLGSWPPASGWRL